MSGVTPRTVACSLAVALLLAAAAAAQAPRGSDLLDQYRNKSAVAAQQFENEIRDAIAEAARVARTDPAKAAEVLKKALGRVEDDAVLSAARRDALKRDLQERLRVADADARRPAGADGAKTAAAAGQKAEQERQAAEQEKINRTLANIRALQGEGRNDEAARQAADLAARYPDNPAAQTAGRATAIADRVIEGRRLQSESERRMVAAFRDVDKSAMPPLGDIEYDPVRWREISKMRKTGPKLTETEKAILNALNSPITLDLKEARFEEFIDYLEKVTGQSLLLDKGSLEQAMVAYETPVKVKAKGLALRTVLRKVLGELGLTYVVKDQAIQVVSVEKAKSMLTTRTYYLGDLLGTLDFRLGPILSQVQAAQNVAALIDYIQQNVDPDGWAVNDRGGLGSITFHGPTMSLVIKQSAEVHYALGGSLR